MAQVTRRKLGPNFSEGARQLWLVMESNGWTQAEEARRLDMPTGQLSKLLYGERKPGRSWTAKIHEELGIEPGTWDMAPVQRFTPPGGRKATPSKVEKPRVKAADRAPESAPPAARQVEPARKRAKAA